MVKELHVLYIPRHNDSRPHILKWPRSQELRARLCHEEEEEGSSHPAVPRLFLPLTLRAESQCLDPTCVHAPPALGYESQPEADRSPAVLKALIPITSECTTPSPGERRSSLEWDQLGLGRTYSSWSAYNTSRRCENSELAIPWLFKPRGWPRWQGMHYWGVFPLLGHPTAWWRLDPLYFSLCLPTRWWEAAGHRFALRKTGREPQLCPLLQNHLPLLSISLICKTGTVSTSKIVLRAKCENVGKKLSTELNI